MNEQLIGDLFAEATRRMTGSSSKEFSQKFAELIVKKCAEIAYNKQYKHSAAHTRGDCAEAIKQHFGVEE